MASRRRHRRTRRLSRGRVDDVADREKGHRIKTSSFFMIAACDASRTFKGLPLRGKTPYKSRPTTPRPLTAKAFAESPSVNMSVQSLPLAPPALLASSSFVIPVNRIFLLPPFLLSCSSCLNLVHARTRSTTPLFSIAFKNLSGKTTFDPKDRSFVVSVSFVCESNAGFTIKAST